MLIAFLILNLIAAIATYRIMLEVSDEESTFIKICFFIINLVIWPMSLIIAIITR